MELLMATLFAPHELTLFLVLHKHTCLATTQPKIEFKWHHLLLQITVRHP